MKKFLLLLCIAGVLAAWMHFRQPDSPSPLQPEQWQQTSQKIKDNSDKVSQIGSRLYRIFDIKKAVSQALTLNEQVPLQNISLHMQQAIIAVEDRRFYSHSGIDLEGMARASLVNLQAGDWEQGGSTITQQLIKNLFLTSDRNLDRKAEEIILALDIEHAYTKEEILSMYLSQIYFGSNAYGIRQAAQVYFGKTPAQLDLAESALLAGLPNAPSLSSPYVNFQAAKDRQALVLKLMVQQGVLSPTQAQEAKEQPLHLAGSTDK